MVAINPDQPLERLARLSGVTFEQRIDQCVDRHGLRTVDEEVELVMLPGVAKPGAQQRTQPGIGRGDQSGSRVFLPAMMPRRLGGQTERIGPRLRPLEPGADVALRIRENRVQGLESTFAPRTVVLVPKGVADLVRVPEQEMSGLMGHDPDEFVLAADRTHQAGMEANDVLLAVRVGVHGVV